MDSHAETEKQAPEDRELETEIEYKKTPKIEAAMVYLDRVKAAFAAEPEVYAAVLDALKDFKSKKLDTRGVIKQISQILREEKELILQFNTFLPSDLKIKEFDLGKKLRTPLN
eukprot:SAG11_NODE_2058_length_3875_cov_2.983051_3_plen_113_part_00